MTRPFADEWVATTSHETEARTDIAGQSHGRGQAYGYTRHIQSDTDHDSRDRVNVSAQGETDLDYNRNDEDDEEEEEGDAIEDSQVNATGLVYDGTLNGSLYRRASGSSPSSASDDLGVSSTAPLSEALIQPTPSPLPEPYIVSQPTTLNTPPFSFGSLLDHISPKIIHDIVMSPVPQGKKFMCWIDRKSVGMDKRIYPTYELFLEDPAVSPRSVFLLRATKKKRSRGSYYAITSDPNQQTDYETKATDDSYGVLGKLRSNFLGTAFHVYSNGRNPFSTSNSNSNTPSNAHQGSSSSAVDYPVGSLSATSDAYEESNGRGYNAGAGTLQQQHPTQRPPSSDRDKRKKKDNKNKHLPVRQELGAVIYNPNVLGLKGPRKMTILMNTMTAEGDLVERRPTQFKDTLIGRMTEGDTSDLLILRNKSPQWNDDTSSFVLNFGGRVLLASVKNFQIVHDNDLDYIIMQFGRTTPDRFSMDCQYPMTPFQAFAFALTSFDAKLACE
ncbi:hypothetical protein BGW38_010809 [Lunasporangiospora selenospora]|uniref:Tubby C-terminal domain-containing protein n=1 Tax=Lunasporangiospora selenospora TaxID=979761 RepID=A0A9P6G453_9FUNG|nr:hypothetical protein BGW38_010809 [Lunasporangiospora selenospora]